MQTLGQLFEPLYYESHMVVILIPFNYSLQVSKSFQGPLILQALAVHLKDIHSVENAIYNFRDNKEP